MLWRTYKMVTMVTIYEVKKVYDNEESKVSSA